MKYLFLLYDNEATMPAFGTQESQKQQDAYGAFYQEATTQKLFQGGDPVQASDTASTVRVRDGSTDAAPGPFHHGSDQIIGFYVLDCKNGDDALKWAAKIPAAHTGAVEVRPILAM